MYARTCEMGCDRCGRTETIIANPSLTVADIKEIGRERGWAVNKEWLCPECKNKENGGKKA